MTAELWLLLIFALATFFQNGLQWYTQVSTYPLFHALPEEGFVAYHQAYEGKLPYSIYAPYTVLIVINVVLFFIRPPELSLGLLVVLLVLNLSIMALSVGFAAPIHARLDLEGKQEALINRLVAWNAVRLVASSLSSALVLYGLARVLAA